MAIEDTFGYRLVRISLVLLNCLVLIRLLAIILQYSHTYDPTFVLLILLIGSNFMAAIIGVIREHRVSVILTGSITLIMFLSIIFAAKENKTLNFSLLTLLAISVQSLIFSEMLKERHALNNRRNVGYLTTMPTRCGRAATNNSNLAAVVVYQSNRDRPNNLFMIDPTFSNDMPKDPPPSYFSASCPPPKYEDAIKLNASEQSLPIVPGEAVSSASEREISTASSVCPSSSSTSSPTETKQIVSTPSTSKANEDGSRKTDLENDKSVDTEISSNEANKLNTK